MWNRIGSGAFALVGGMMIMKGMGDETTWTQIPSLMTPMTVAGLGMVVWRAVAGKEQFKMPKNLPTNARKGQ